MITKNYIKMCEKNDDLQKQWLPIIPDLCIHNHKIRWLLRFTKDIFEIDKNIDKWLPTIEQLFEIVLTLKEYKQDIKDLNWYMIFSDIEEFTEECWKFYSMQEIILAFVMYKKYSKIWTGDKWTLLNKI